MTEMFHVLRRLLLCLVVTVPAFAAAENDLRPPPQTFASALRYDSEYPVIGYGGIPHDNVFAELQQRIDRGELKLEYSAPRGYLDSLLKAIGVDPSSQTLVYSKTSLQVTLITAATPRAIYFNDDAYVAWIRSLTSTARPTAASPATTRSRSWAAEFRNSASCRRSSTPAAKRSRTKCPTRPPI